MTNAVRTSNTECCFINIVDAMMDDDNIREAALMPFLFSKFLLLIIAKCAPSELYTWMLGQRLVGVSTRQSALII